MRHHRSGFGSLLLYSQTKSSFQIAFRGLTENESTINDTDRGQIQTFLSEWRQKPSMNSAGLSEI